MAGVRHDVNTPRKRRRRDADMWSAAAARRRRRTALYGVAQLLGRSESYRFAARRNKMPSKFVGILFRCAEYHRDCRYFLRSILTQYVAGYQLHFLEAIYSGAAAALQSVLCCCCCCCRRCARCLPASAADAVLRTAACDGYGRYDFAHTMCHRRSRCCRNE